MRLVAVLLLLVATVDPAIKAQLGAPVAGERARGIQALMRFHDPSSPQDRDLVERAWFDGTWIERAAALRALCDRHWPDGLPKAHEERVLDSLDELDTDAHIAAVECLEKIPAKKAAALRAVQLEVIRGRGSTTTLTRAVLGSVARNPDPQNDVELARTGQSLFGAAGSEIVQLTPYGAWVLIALAAHGTDTRSRFAKTMELSAESDFGLAARLNRIRAGSGDPDAIAKLVETAKIGMQPELRREAVELLLSLPAEPRRAALLSLADRMNDVDGPVRALLVREAARESLAFPVEQQSAIEALLVRGLADPFPDLRMESAAGLFDRAGAGVLSIEAQAAAKRALAKESDPLAKAALEHLLNVPAK